MPALLEAAVEFACAAHRGQLRDGESPLPYITHPMDVLNKVRYIGRIEDEAILSAAALHDVVEESEVTGDEIRERFGSRIADLVRELTRTEPHPSELEGLSKPQIWQKRSAMLLADIAEMSPEAMIVKLADRLSNLEGAYATKKGDKLNRYLDQTFEILRIIPQRINPPLWEAIQAMLSGD